MTAKKMNAAGLAGLAILIAGGGSARRSGSSQDSIIAA
jgi:hypothetical protein